MGYNVSFVSGDIFVGGSKVECFVKEILANGRIEFFDIKAIEVRVLFSLSGVKPVDYRCSVFPLVKVAFTGDGIVDAIKDCFAYFAYLGFSWVDYSAGRFVSEVGLVVFECYECFLVGCSVYSVIDAKSSSDIFVFRADVSRSFGFCFFV